MTDSVEAPPGLRLFEGYGVEIEYMIVDQESLAVLPIADRVLIGPAGAIENEVEHGDISWSNELVLHVVELKTTAPAPSLQGLAPLFHGNVLQIDALLAQHSARLLPTAMHPWMDPLTETKLWPHDSQEIYATFNRIFDCRGHGWSNLQSVHLNLPFTGDDEFGRLHAAIRLLLPILPALAASSPIFEGKVADARDARLVHYRRNCARLPIVTGRVIPEAVFDRSSYEQQILEPIAVAVAPFDSDEELEAEWVNARGAIARFVRDSIEIRVVDVQEHPSADLGIAQLAVFLLQELTEGKTINDAAQRAFSVEELEAIFTRCALQAGAAQLGSADYCAALGLPDRVLTAGEAWARILERAMQAGAIGSDEARALAVILEQGSLADRIVSATGPTPSHADLERVYRGLAQCLRAGLSFEP